jgi:hypothetical protein
MPLINKILQLDARHKFEMEIEEINGKLQVMKHLGDKDDTTIRTKMEEMNGVFFYFIFIFSVQEMNGVLQQRVDDQNDMEEMINIYLLISLLFFSFFERS